MCDVCSEHNAYGLDDTDEDIFLHCHECDRAINPYNEPVHVWGTSTKPVMLCTGCNRKRLGKKVE